VVFDPSLNSSAGEQIRSRRVELAAEMVRLQFDRSPALRDSLDDEGVAKSIRDAEYNLQFLSEAIASGDPGSFASYLVWLDGVLAGVGLSRSVLDGHLDCLLETLAANLDTGTGALATEYVESGRRALATRRGGTA